MHGWLPLTVQAVAVVVLAAAIGWRTRRWRLIWLPVSAGIGITLAPTSFWFTSSQGLADDPAPTQLWVWLAVTGMAAVVLVAGWPGARWWRRTASLVGLPLCLSCAALALNAWVGYFPTVQTAWNQLTAGPLPDQADQATVVAMRVKHQIPIKGVVVSQPRRHAGRSRTARSLLHSRGSRARSERRESPQWGYLVGLTSLARSVVGLGGNDLRQERVGSGASQPRPGEDTDAPPESAPLAGSVGSDGDRGRRPVVVPRPILGQRLTALAHQDQCGRPGPVEDAGATHADTPVAATRIVA